MLGLIVDQHIYNFFSIYQTMAKTNLMYFPKLPEHLSLHVKLIQYRSKTDNGKRFIYQYLFIQTVHIHDLLYYKEIQHYNFCIHVPCLALFFKHDSWITNQDNSFRLFLKTKRRYIPLISKYSSWAI